MADISRQGVVCSTGQIWDNLCSQCSHADGPEAALCFHVFYTSVLYTLYIPTMVETDSNAGYIGAAVSIIGSTISVGGVVLQRYALRTTTVQYWKLPRWWLGLAMVVIGAFLYITPDPGFITPDFTYIFTRNLYPLSEVPRSTRSAARTSPPFHLLPPPPTTHAHMYRCSM